MMADRPRPTGMRAFADELREMAWLYLALILVLTGLFVASGSVGPEGVMLQLAVNFVICVGIGISVSAVHHLGLEPLARAVGLGAPWALRVVSVATGLWVGAGLASRLLSWGGLISDPGATAGGIRRIGLVISAVIFAIAVAIERSAAARRALERRERDARQEAALAQLRELQARTDPHFLFNALNSVASLIGGGEPERAEAAVERLADVFRYALEGSRKDRVPLGRELAAIDDYLAIEHLRLGDRLRIVREVDPTLAEVPVPPLVLQPLVENAVVHGASTGRAGATVWLRVRRTPGGLLLQVEDDGDGSAASGGSGTALDDLGRRLALTAVGAKVRAGPSELGWASEVWLPMEGP